MHTTVAHLKKGETGTITEIDVDLLPLKLLEMGCLPGNGVTLLQVAPMGDPLYLDVNGARLAIRKETAELIHIEIPSRP